MDIFHETYYTMADNCPASARRIITVYDMIHEIFPEYFEPGLLSRFLKIKAHAINRADHVICISENTKIDLIKLLAIPEEKISVVHLGSSLIQNHHVDSVTDTGVQKPYLLFVGNRTGHKNFNRLLHAYAKFPLLRDKFQLVCFGGDVFSPDEIQLVHSLSLDTDRILHIKGGDSYLADIYASASALVYPSIYEGFGIPPLEAMLLGCPVISSNSSSLPEILGDAAEFFDPVDITAIGMAITRVVTDPERCKSLITAGQIRAQSFSWEKCAKNTLDVYQQVLSRES